MWIYRAYDQYGLPIAEAYRKSNLIEKLIDEFGENALEEYWDYIPKDGAKVLIFPPYTWLV